MKHDELKPAGELKSLNNNFLLKFNSIKNEIKELNISDQDLCFADEKDLSKNYVSKLSYLNSKFELKYKELQNKISKDKIQLKDYNIRIMELSDKNSENKNKIITEDEKYENEYNLIKMNQEDFFNETLKEINLIRKQNFLDFDKKIEKYSMTNKTLRMSKKKLYLLMNFLKFRVLNFNTINSNQNKKICSKTYHNKTNYNEGYLIHSDKQIIYHLKIDDSLNDYQKSIIFWQSFINFFSKKQND